jgi:hypothetical protein
MYLMHLGIAVAINIVVSVLVKALYETKILETLERIHQKAMQIVPILEPFTLVSTHALGLSSANLEPPQQSVYARCHWRAMGIGMGHRSAGAADASGYIVVPSKL